VLSEQNTAHGKKTMYAFGYWEVYIRPFNHQI